MIRDQIHQTDEYQTLTAANADSNGSGGGGGGGGSAPSVNPSATIGDTLDPVLSWEKGDVEFWMQVAQLIVLLLILRELQGGGR